MFLIFNWVGLAIIIISLIFYYIFEKFVSHSVSTFYLFNGFIFIILDLLTRFWIIKKYFSKYKIKGGSLFLIPMYTIGIICILFGIYFYFNP